MLKGIFITGGLLAALAASSSDNRQEPWASAVSKEGKVSFSVPVKPHKIDINKSDIPAAQFEAVTATSRYLIVAGALSPLQQSVIKEKESDPGLYTRRYMLDCLVDGFIRGAQGKKEGDAYFKFQGMPARRVTIVKDSQRIRVFGVVAKTHMYLFSAGYPTGYASQKEYTRFYNSIRIAR